MSSFAAAWCKISLVLQNQVSPRRLSPHSLPQRAIQRMETIFVPGLPTTGPRELSEPILDVKLPTSYLGLLMHISKSKHAVIPRTPTHATSAAMPPRSLLRPPPNAALWSVRLEELRVPAPSPLNPAEPVAAVVIQLRPPPKGLRGWLPSRASASVCSTWASMLLRQRWSVQAWFCCKGISVRSLSIFGLVSIIERRCAVSGKDQRFVDFG